MSAVILEENEFMKDPKYRLYVTAVDKALKSFEYSSEWADLISALGKLNKILTTYAKYPAIPRRIKISKRLAQCMHPALPSGVHLKALETYDIIFRTMGTFRLSQELFIYSAGLFPLLGNAATNVKPTLLTVYETHFVPLGESLGPGLSGFLSGVLPGLEEGSDYFTRTNALLEMVCEAVNPITFYGHLWDCLEFNGAVRLPAILFILSHFDKNKPIESQLHIMGTCIDTMVNGLCACLYDSSVLVQRSALDFLLLAFPMHNSQLVSDNLQRLISCALTTILRRDMSLNRRLYAWLLGSEVHMPTMNCEMRNKKSSCSSVNSDFSEQYFEVYSKELLIRGVKDILFEATNEKPHDLRPYRILISLLDKADIGPVILDDILQEVFRLFYLCSKNPGEEAPNNTELLKNANLLFSALEPRYLWQYTGILFSNACQRVHAANTEEQNDNHQNNNYYDDDAKPISHVRPVNSGEPSLLEVCDLIVFLLDTLSLELYSETLTEHLPELFLYIITTLMENCDSLHCYHMATSLKLAIKILSQVRSPLASTASNVADLGYSSLDNANVATAGAAISANRNKLSEPGKIVQLKTSSEEVNNKQQHTTGSLSGSVSSSGLQETEFASLKSDTTSGIDVTSSSSLETLTPFTNMDSRSSTSNETLVAFNEGCSNDVPTIVNCLPRHKQTIMEKCVKQYEKFYVTFVYCMRIKVGEIKNMDDLFQLLRIKSPDEAAEDRLKHLHELLNIVLYNDNQIIVSRFLDNRRDCRYYYNEQLETKLISLMKILHSKRCAAVEWIQPVHYACKLLLDLSIFQTSVAASSSSPSALTDENNMSRKNEDLPEWLKTLIVCSCWLGSVAAPVQLICINTLLDLALLCRRLHQQSARVCAAAASPATAAGSVTPVVLVSMLKSYHLEFIELKTNVFQVITYWLWEHLANPMFSLRSAELLYQLQSMLLSTDIIENCIAECCSRLKPENERMLSFRKFATLWHIGREITRFSDASSIDDIFYKCMLKMLDNLEFEESSPLKIEAENWLFHSFLRGDTRRLLDPILIALLDPSTARVSVLHARIQFYIDGARFLLPSTQQQQDDGGGDYRIYSITLSENNTIYHICSRTNSVYPSFRRNTTALVSSQNSVISENGGGLIVESEELSKGAGMAQDSKMVSDSQLEVAKNNNSFASLESLRRNSSSVSVPQINIIRSSSCDLIVNGSSSSSIGSSGGGGINSTLNDSNKQEQSRSSPKDVISFDVDCDLMATLSSSFSSSISNVADSSNQSNNCSGSNNNNQNPLHSENNNLLRSESSTSQLSDQSAFSGIISSEIVSEIVDSVIQQTPSSLKSNKMEGGSSSSSSSNGPVNCSTSKQQPPNANELDECLKTAGTAGRNNDGGGGGASSSVNIDTLHSHVIIYCGLYDTLRVIYLFRTVRNMVVVNPPLFLLSAANCTVGQHSLLLQLFIRHRKAIFARGFYANIDSSLTSVNKQHHTYLEILITTCLYYARSFYPNFAHVKLTDKELTGNRQVQVASVELLTLICCHLCDVVRDNGRSLSSYLCDLFFRCKIQKITLYCILSVLSCSDDNNNNNNNFADEDDVDFQTVSCSLTHDILQFNCDRKKLPPSIILSSKYNTDTFQIHLLRLLLSLIVLEYEISSHRPDAESIPVNSAVESNSEYMKNSRIPHQPLFCSALSKALQSDTSMHHHWTSFIICSLPYLKKSLGKIITVVVQQISRNIETASESYIKSDSDPSKLRLPVDYMIMQLESLTTLCQYCLIDSSQPLNQSIPNVISVSKMSPLPVFIGLTNVLNSPVRQLDQKEETDIRHSGKRFFLNAFPSIIASIGVLWSALITSKRRDNDNNVAGKSSVVKSQILQLLSKMAASNHSTHFVASFAIVWNQNKSVIVNSSTKSVMTDVSNSQKILVQMLYAIKSLPMDTLLHTIHQVIKQPPAFTNPVSVTNQMIEVNILELLAEHVHLANASQLTECWPSLLSLFRDLSSLSPPSQFILLHILYHFVQRSTLTRMDKKDQKDLQDTITKAVEQCNQIAGTCLEQTTWLRRNLAVKGGDESSSATGVVTIKDAEKGGALSQYCLTAQMVLAELLAPMLDIAFGSQEKERVITLLGTLMYNVTPYLRNHTQKNANSFYACSLLLSNLSNYQYTRKAWRREAMELLLDSNLFQMEPRSLSLWRIIIDNLMSPDLTSFRDLLGRISTSQSNSLSLFSSKELEYEQRAQLLKRLAFVILCGEQDQFYKQIPDIQEKLAESLRLPQGSPLIQAQVFLCFRVLLLRMSAEHITSLWPLIITELVQVMLQIEQEATFEPDEFFSPEDGSGSSSGNILKSSGRNKKRWHHRKSAKLNVDDDPETTAIVTKDQNSDSTSPNSDNGGLQQLNTYSQCLQLQLAAAKLLKFAIQLPANRLPQFQMYKWAFVGNLKHHETKFSSESPNFIPHVIRITQLMDKKYGGSVDSLPAVLLPSGCGIRTLQDLHPFFSALSRELPQIVSIRTLSELEHEIQLDFIEPLASSRFSSSSPP